MDRAVITHAHGDHAQAGSKAYLTAEPGRPLLRKRLGAEAKIEALPYRKSITLGEVRMSFYPAGHLLGSAQVRIERGGEVWVASGDYKTQRDPTCDPLEVIRCHTFITESTFALPIYRWPKESLVMNEINAWWRNNQEQGHTGILFVYALGKAQRVLAGIDASIGPILCHGAITRINDLYRELGVKLPPTETAEAENSKTTLGRALVLATPSVRISPWIRKFTPYSTAFASGWMQIRGARRRRALDRGFVLSDHADWDGLLSTIATTGAERIGVMHGDTAVFARYLRETGRDVFEIETHYDPIDEETEA